MPEEEVEGASLRTLSKPDALRRASPSVPLDTEAELGSERQWQGKNMARFFGH